MYKVVLFSSFMSPHMKPLCDELYAHYGNDFQYIQTCALTEERQRLGYSYEPCEVPYLTDLTGNTGQQMRIADEAAAVIINTGVTNPMIVKNRIFENKLTFFLNERLFKRGVLKLADRRLWQQALINLASRNKRTYILCLGSYVAKDFELIGFERGKSFKFGYFPAQTLSKPKERSDNFCVVWAGRMIDWKRPIFAMKIAKRLKQKDADIRFIMVGDGKYFEKAKHYATKYRIEVEFTGIQPNEVVRKYMRDADVFLITSNRREGWGAVINEALSEGTPVVSSTAIGGAGFLIEDGKNGFLFKTHSARDAAERISQIYDGSQKEYSEEAIKTLDLWNYQIAAQRLCTVIDELLNNRNPTEYTYGPMSRC